MEKKKRLAYALIGYSSFIIGSLILLFLGAKAQYAIPVGIVGGFGFFVGMLILSRRFRRPNIIEEKSNSPSEL